MPDAERDPTVKCEVCIFPTELGWFGIQGVGKRLERLAFGHASADDVRQALGEQQGASSAALRESDWHPELRKRLVRFARGERVRFDDIDLKLPPMTPFQERVIAATRRIPYGVTLSYGELAEKAGFPRAARAVGSVMASNRIPILVPCHRVIASAGKLGGYSSVHGVSLKQVLLKMESEAVSAG